MVLLQDKHWVRAKNSTVHILQGLPHHVVISNIRIWPAFSAMCVIIKPERSGLVRYNFYWFVNLQVAHLYTICRWAHFNVKLHFYYYLGVSIRVMVIFWIFLVYFQVQVSSGNLSQVGRVNHIRHPVPKRKRSQNHRHQIAPPRSVPAVVGQTLPSPSLVSDEIVAPTNIEGLQYSLQFRLSCG